MKCQKCGSEDLHTRFYYAGNSYVKTIPGSLYQEYVRTTEEILRHHCRNCHYEWNTEPLDKSIKGQ